jgi:hypothetical protein
MTPAERLAQAKTGEVFTFAADEPLGHVRLPARVAGITIRGGVLSSIRARPNPGLRLENVGLAFQSPAAPSKNEPRLGDFSGCDGMVWEGGQIIGKPRPDGTREGQPCYLTNCNDVIIRGLLVEGFGGGIRCIGGSGHLVEDNEVRRVRGSLVQVTTEGNSALRRNFCHTPLSEDYGGAGDHGNLTSVRPIGEAPGIAVEGNTLVVGQGLKTFCGIDMKQDSTPAGVHWMVAPLIVGNIVSTSHGYGVRIQQVKGGLVEGNALHWAKTGPDDRAGPRCQIWSPIRLGPDGGKLVVRDSGEPLLYKLTADDLDALDAA